MRSERSESQNGTHGSFEMIFRRGKTNPWY